MSIATACRVGGLAARLGAVVLPYPLEQPESTQKAGTRVLQLSRRSLRCSGQAPQFGAAPAVKRGGIDVLTAHAVAGLRRGGPAARRTRADSVAYSALSADSDATGGVDSAARSEQSSAVKQHQYCALRGRQARRDRHKPQLQVRLLFSWPRCLSFARLVCWMNGLLSTALSLGPTRR